MNIDNRKCKIYLLKNTVNGKIYVGQTWLELNKRFGKNGCNYSNSIYLFNAIKHYGADKFEYKLLAECDDQDEANKLESEYIEKYNSRDLNVGYNLKEGGSNGKHSEETKLKISQNAAKPWLGKHITDEMKKAISDANTGRLHTEEWKEQNSEFMIKRHKEDGHPMQGKHHTDEAKAQMSEKLKGQVHSRESIERGAKKRQMKKEKENALIKAYQSNEAVPAILERLGAKTSALYRVLKRNNIPLRQKIVKGYKNII